MMVFETQNIYDYAKTWILRISDCDNALFCRQQVKKANYH